MEDAQRRPGIRKRIACPHGVEPATIIQADVRVSERAAAHTSIEVGGKRPGLPLIQGSHMDYVSHRWCEGEVDLTGFPKGNAKLLCPIADSHGAGPGMRRSEIGAEGEGVVEPASGAETPEQVSGTSLIEERIDVAPLGRDINGIGPCPIVETVVDIPHSLVILPITGTTPESVDFPIFRWK
jgi:hypothetical protein